MIEIKGKSPTHKPLGPIKVWGPGLENGVFPEYQGHFFVDATGAGGGELHVSVMGLKGECDICVVCITMTLYIHSTSHETDKKTNLIFQKHNSKERTEHVF